MQKTLLWALFLLALPQLKGQTTITDPDDGATAEHYTYSGGVNGHTVELFKVLDGEHSWPGWPLPGSGEITCMDFDACNEIWRFFSRYERTTLSLKEDPAHDSLKVWPNPTPGALYLQHARLAVTKIVVVDMYGQVVKTQTGTNLQMIDLSHLDQGIYLIVAFGDNFYTYRKTMVLSR